MKECPYCGEEILATAKKCKHCGEFLDGTKKEESNTQLAGVVNYKGGMIVKCPTCGYEGKPKHKIGGNTFVELILLICGIIPGIIYSIYRRSTGTAKCPKCGNCMLIIKKMK